MLILGPVFLPGIGNQKTFVQRKENTNYAMYGLPLFKATAVKYGWENPIGDDNGDEEFYNE